MASQASQRVRRIPSPSTKQGPMKATKSFGLGPSGSRPSGVKKSSPSASPTQQAGGDFHRKRRSPDHRQSPDRALSPVLKGRSVSGASPVIKRTNSLDNIVGPYLKGEWPREPVQYSSQPAIVITHPFPRSTEDQHTQTPVEWQQQQQQDDGVDRRRVLSSHKRSHSVGNGSITENVPKEKVKGVRLGKSNLLRGKHSPRFRGSTEGINQEIEKLSLRSISGADDMSSRDMIMTPDGHRAPVQELLQHHHHHHNTRSAITQTPSRPPLPPAVSTAAAAAAVSTASSDRVSPGCEAVSPCCCSPSSSSSSSSAASSRASSAAAKEDKDCESPDPKEFMFIREPPDGAEKVSLKVLEEDRRNVSRCMPVVLKPPSLCIPSTKSAFNPLLKLYQPSPFKPPPPTSTPSPTDTAAAAGTY